MPEAILAGQNGQPAVDQETGLPLTMEELLRRRGILSYKGVSSPLNASATLPDINAHVVNASDAVASVLGDPRAPKNLTNTEIGADGVDANGNPIGTPLAAPKLTDGAAQTVPEPGSDPSSWLEWLLGGAGVGAAAYAASKLRRGGKTPTAAEAMADEMRAGRAYNPNYTVNDTLERVPTNEVRGSNRRLASNVDGSNVARAGEIGAGPKLLSGPAPVTDVAGDNLTRAVAASRNRGPLPDFYEPGSRSRTRMQTGALQANQSRVQPTGNEAIMLRDRYSDLAPDELKVATQIAGRLKSDRSVARGPNRMGSTQVRNRNMRAAQTTGRPIRAPEMESEQLLSEAVNIVRALKAQGLPMSRILPRLRVP